MRTTIINGVTVITADEGKVLRRISDRLIMGNQVYLGYTYYIDMKKLDEPILEIPEHYEEIEEPIESEEYDLRNTQQRDGR